MWSNKNIFRCGNITADVDYPELRLTVDHAEDFELVTKIYEALYSERRPFELADVMTFLDKNPKLAKLNKKWNETENYRTVLEK